MQSFIRRRMLQQQQQVVENLGGSRSMSSSCSRLMNKTDHQVSPVDITVQDASNVGIGRVMNRKYATYSGPHGGGNADTHMVGNSEIERHGLAKRPPGSGPGEYLHQRAHFPREFFKSKEMMPVYPMLIMVSVGVGLGMMTMYHMMRSPSILVAKGKRRDAPYPELDEIKGSAIAAESNEFREHSFWRRMSLKMPDPFMRLNHNFFHQPPRLPGDDKPDLLPAVERSHNFSPPDYVP